MTGKKKKVLFGFRGFCTDSSDFSFILPKNYVNLKKIGFEIAFFSIKWEHGSAILDTCGQIYLTNQNASCWWLSYLFLN